MKLFVSIFTACLFFACDDSVMEKIITENKSAGNEGSGYVWKKTANIATPRSGAAFALYDGNIYIYGGEDGSGVLTDFWKYNLATGSYESLNPPAGNPGSAYSDFTVLDGKLYLFGGKTASGLSRDLYCYDTTANSWTVISGPSGFNGTTPGARYSHVTLSYTEPSTSEKNIFVQGGYDSSGMADGALYKLTDLGEAKPNWSKIGIGLVTGAHSAVLTGDKIYFFGGYDSDANIYSNSVYLYDPGKGVLTSLSSTDIAARSGMHILLDSSGFFTYGGTGESGCLMDEWFYSLSEQNWKRYDDGIDKRAFYSSASDDARILIYGGYSENSAGQRSYNSELWEVVPR